MKRTTALLVVLSWTVAWVNSARAKNMWYYGMNCPACTGGGFWDGLLDPTKPEWEQDSNGICTTLGPGDDAIFGCWMGGTVTIKFTNVVGWTFNSITVTNSDYVFTCANNQPAPGIFLTTTSGRFTVAAGRTASLGATMVNAGTGHGDVTSPLVFDGPGTVNFTHPLYTCVDSYKLWITNGGTVMGVGLAFVPNGSPSPISDYYKLDNGGTLYFHNYGPTFNGNCGITIDPGGGRFHIDSGYTVTFPGPAVSIVNGPLTVIGPGTLNLNGPCDMTDNAFVTGTGGFMKGPGVYTGTTNDFTGPMGFSGLVNIAFLHNYGTAGPLGARPASAETAIADGVALHFCGGTLQYTGSSGVPQSTDRQIRILNGPTGGTIDASGAGPNDTVSFTYAGGPTNFWDGTGTRTLTLTGSNTGENTFAHNIMSHSTGHTTLAKTGAGTWDLTSPHNGDAQSDVHGAYGGYGGGTIISGGTLGFVNGGLGGGIIDVTGDATLRWDAGNSMDISSGTGAGAARSLQIESGVTATLDLGTNNVTLTGAVGGGSGALTKAGTGKLTLSGGNSYAGDTTISAGTLQLGDGVAHNGSVAGNIVNNGSLIFAPVSNQSYTGNISGSGFVTVQAAGTTFVVGGNNSYTGGTLAAAGLIEAASDGSLGNGDLLVSSNAFVQFDTTVGCAHMSASADLLLETRSDAAAVIYFTGTETIHSISFDGGATFETCGDYGEPGSGAGHETPLFGSGYGGVFRTTACLSATALASSANLAAYGSSITFTSTVTGPGGTPTGTVTFYDGALVIGASTLDDAGRAILIATNLQVAGSPHAITALYGGNPALTRSTSSALLQTITPIASATLLTSSLNPSTVGSSVTFTATVRAAFGTPAGNAVFKINGTPFATVALNGSGQAQASTPALPVGTNAIVAEYAAQGNYLASTGTLQVVTIPIIVQTNSIVSIVNNGDGSFTLTVQGTPEAQYHVVASSDVAAAMNTWTPVPGSTNTAPSPRGQWTVIVSNAAPRYYRSLALNPCP